MPYRIRNVFTGQYSLGGSHPSFSNKGKIWKERGHLSNHFRQVRPEVYKHCVIEELELTVISEEPTMDWIDDLNRRKEQEKAARQKRWDDQKREQEIEQLCRLQEKYGNQPIQ